MKTPEEKSYEIKIMDDILYITLLHDNVTEEMMDVAINERLALTQDQSYPFLADIRKLKSVSRAAKQRLIQKDSFHGVLCTAFLIDSKTQEVMFHFFKIFYKIPIPIKMFTNKEKALEWVQQYKIGSSTKTVEILKFATFA